MIVFSRFFLRKRWYFFLFHDLLPLYLLDKQCLFLTRDPLNDFSAFLIAILPTPSDCSPPLPPRPWRSVRTQGWPSPLGCPTSTTSSWRRSWTSRGSSTSLSATRWAAQLLCLLLFRTSFLPWHLMSVCPPLLFIRHLGTEGSREQSFCLDGVNRIHNSIFDKIWVENMWRTYH